MGSLAQVRLLLDTHVWLWIHLEPNKIKPAIQRELQKEENELWLSPVSLWETLMLYRKRRLALQPHASAWIDSALTELPVHEATLNFSVALLSEKLTLKMKDPADRFLAATASVFNLVFVTADRHFRTTQQFTVLRT
jgi:PIN domain nuclease of toxin-antitoxin system